MITSIMIALKVFNFVKYIYILAVKIYFLNYIMVLMYHELLRTDFQMPQSWQVEKSKLKVKIVHLEVKMMVNFG